MAKIDSELSRTFSEYLLLPNLTTREMNSENVSLVTPLVKYKKGREECPIQMNIPMVSAIMQSVSGDRMAIALARSGGLAFIFSSQTIESQCEMLVRAKKYKAGFVSSDSNLKPDDKLSDILKLKEKTGHSTVAITDDGSANGKLLGIVTSRDYREIGRAHV